MQTVVALTVVLGGCGALEGLDLDSSANPHPYAAAEMVTMSWAVQNAGEPRRWDVRGDRGELWQFTAPQGYSVERIECQVGEVVCAIGDPQPGDPSFAEAGRRWGSVCGSCGMGSQDVRF